MVTARGFSLIELLVVLVIVGFLVRGVGAIWYEMSAVHRRVIAIDQLLGGIQLARSEAVKWRSVITLCPSADHKTCGGRWSDGQIVFVDKAKQGQVSNPSDVLRVIPPPPHGGKLTWNGVGYLQMVPTGHARSHPGRFCYTPADNNVRHKRAVVVSSTGRARVEVSPHC